LDKFGLNFSKAWKKAWKIFQGLEKSG